MRPTALVIGADGARPPAAEEEEDTGRRPRLLSSSSTEASLPPSFMTCPQNVNISHEAKDQIKAPAKDATHGDTAQLYLTKGYNVFPRCVKF